MRKMVRQLSRWIYIFDDARRMELTRTRKGLTRKESQAKTRAKLIAVARKHFLRHGLGSAVSDQIAKDAGFTRGALYANFPGKEELFLAVIDATREAHLKKVREIQLRDVPNQEKFRLLRELYADLVTDFAWTRLYTEFQAGALHNERIRQRFLAHCKESEKTGAAIVKMIMDEDTSEASAEQITRVVQSFAHGLAVRQTLEGTKAHSKRVRELVLLCCDRLTNIKASK